MLLIVGLEIGAKSGLVWLLSASKPRLSAERPVAEDWSEYRLETVPFHPSVQSKESS
ncbi:hypothetical protein D9M68_170000 [compost metagenome]